MEYSAYLNIFYFLFSDKILNSLMILAQMQNILIFLQDQI